MRVQEVIVRFFIIFAVFELDLWKKQDKTMGILVNCLLRVRSVFCCFRIQSLILNSSRASLDDGPGEGVEKCNVFKSIEKGQTSKAKFFGENEETRGKKS